MTPPAVWGLRSEPNPWALDHCPKGLPRLLRRDSFAQPRLLPRGQKGHSPSHSGWGAVLGRARRFVIEKGYVKNNRECT